MIRSTITSRERTGSVKRRDIAAFFTTFRCEAKQNHLIRRGNLMMKMLASSLFLMSVLYWQGAWAAEDALSVAQKEKKVVVYNTTTAPDMAAVAQGIKKKYPFADVEGYRGTGGKMLQRITTEIKAGQNLADVYLISGLQTWLLKDMNLLNPYRSPEREKIPSALRDREGFWTGVYWNLEVLGHNSKLVADREIPKKWEDLLAP